MSERFDVEQDTDSPYHSSDDAAERRRVPDDLPKVAPPSAGFIVQLFVVPALIVGALIGGWVLVRRMVSSEQNWQALVVELRSGNTYRRDRASVGLAQILRADAEMGEQSQQLSRNAQVAGELSRLLREQLSSAVQDENAIGHEAFLARTLGMLDVPETTLPVLQQAMRPEYDREVRKNAVAAVALIAGRAEGRGKVASDAGLMDDVVEFSADPDPFLRQLGAYTLGLFPAEQTQPRLTVLLSDPDRKTRMNAAVGLARQGSTAGLPVFKEVLADAVRPIDAEGVEGETVEERRRAAMAREFEQLISIKNSLKAISDLEGSLSADERKELAKLIEPIAEGSRDPGMRMEAAEVVKRLSGE